MIIVQVEIKTSHTIKTNTKNTMSEAHYNAIFSLRIPLIVGFNFEQS